MRELLRVQRAGMSMAELLAITAAVLILLLASTATILFLSVIAAESSLAKEARAYTAPSVGRGLGIPAGFYPEGWSRSGSPWFHSGPTPQQDHKG